MANTQWLNQMYQAGVNSGLSDLQARVMASQAALESGWGKSGLSTKANNYFGMKAGSSWGGDTITMPTKEQAPDGSWYTENAKFRRYGSMEEGMADKSAMMARNWPGAMQAQSWDQAMAGLQNGRHGAYATDQNYASKLASINAKINPGSIDPASMPQGGYSPPVADASGLAGLAAQGQGVAQGVAAALPTVGATAPQVATSDPMSGVFGLLLQERMKQAPQPMVAPAQPVRRAPDTRSEEEKLASVSQTPDVYLERMRRNSNG